MGKTRSKCMRYIVEHDEMNVFFESIEEVVKYTKAKALAQYVVLDLETGDSKVVAQ
jgi:hypothetical protein